MSDIFRVTLLNDARQKFFEAEVPMDKPNKVRELLLLCKSKGVDLKEPSRKDNFDWF